METTYNEQFAELERGIRQNQNVAICDFICDKANQYFKILENGQEIYKHSLGDRFERMYILRNNLWSKIFLLHDLVGEIEKMK